MLTVSTGADEQTSNNQEDHKRARRRDLGADAWAGDPLPECCRVHAAIVPDPWQLPKVTGERLRQQEKMNQIADSARLASAAPLRAAACRSARCVRCRMRASGLEMLVHAV